MKPTQILKKDHANVKALFRKLHNANSSGKEKIFAQIEHELKIHTKIEEDLVYPRLRDDDPVLVTEAYEEHALVDYIFEQIDKARQDDEWEARVKILEENVKLHVQEEEKSLFPLLNKVIDAAEQKELAQQMQEMKQELLESMEVR